MKIDEEFIKNIETLGASASDIANTMRPDGPLDKVIVTVRCTKCRKETSMSLRELHRVEWRCRCGAPLEDKEFREDLKILVRGGSGPYQTLSFLPDIAHENPNN